jgi:hypothetical protein
VVCDGATPAPDPEELNMHTDTHHIASTGQAPLTGDPLIGARRVTGTAVYDAAGDKIGSIDDVMLAKRSGQVAYAVMSFGGFLGIGEKLTPLPWHALDYDTDLGGYRVASTGDALRETLTAAPSYSREDFDRDDWLEPTERHYRSSPGSMALPGL